MVRRDHAASSTDPGAGASRAGRGGTPPAHLTGEWDPALLVLAIGITIFWMIPRSVDLTASSAPADQLQHLSAFLAGIVFARTLPRMPIVATMALGIHGVAMLAAQGLVYTLYPGLICTAYTLQQQQTAGRILLYVVPVLGLGLWVGVMRGVAGPTVPTTGGPVGASASL